MKILGYMVLLAITSSGWAYALKKPKLFTPMNRSEAREIQRLQMQVDDAMDQLVIKFRHERGFSDDYQLINGAWVAPVGSHD